MDFSHLIKRHPLEIEAYFDFVFVLTYAFQKDILRPLLPPGLELDTAGELAFVAVAIVQTRRMHPKGIPEWIAQDYALVGYRIFVRYKTLAGRNLRGLKILRSDTDSGAMVALGNLLTHYNFHSSNISFNNSAGTLEVSSKASDGISNFAATANLLAPSDSLPPGSPFSSVREALKFAGPMPFTFDYEKETNSILRVEGVRENWHPRAVSVEVKQTSFFDQTPFASSVPILCSAFYVQDIPYLWKSAVCEVLP